MSFPEASELKGCSISDPAAMVERLEQIVDKLGAALERQRAENARLRRIESAATRALADLDALITESETAENTQPKVGHGR